MSEQEKLREAVYTNGFAADEARLFLDTHPQSAEAMTYYQHKIDLYKEAVKAYEEKFGPISPESGVKNGVWVWGTTTWPWEGGM